MSARSHSARSVSVRSAAAAMLAIPVIGALPVFGQDPAFHATFLDDYDVPGDTYSDVWAVGTTAYIGHFGLNVVDVVDVSTPTSLSLTTQIVVPAPNDACSAQDIKIGQSVVDPSVTLGFVAFDAAAPDMFGIYDLSVPSSPVLLTTVVASTYVTSHNLSYRSDGWLASCDSIADAVALFDFSGYDPASPPSSISSLDYEITGLGTGFVHDVTLTDDFLFVAEWDALVVYDVRNLDTTAPIYLGEVEGYSCHAVWPTSDNEYIVTADERGGGAIRLYKMTDDGSSVILEERDSYVAPDTGTYMTFSAHNPVVAGDRAYVSNYEAGVIVLQIDRTTDTWERVASFDTSLPGGLGCWGVYPFLGEEIVLASDFEEGLIALDFSALQFRSTIARLATVVPWATTAITVDIDALGTDVLDPATVLLFSRVDGASFSSAPMALVGGTTWTGDLPAADCESRIDYYFSADDTTGETFTAPAVAPTDVYTTYASLALTTVFEDDFETDKGWTVVDDASVIGPGWERVAPTGTGLAPGYDADGSGNCFVTGNGFPGAAIDAFDLDGGPTTLTSPALDFAAADGVISYWRWQANDDSDTTDGLVVEVSNGGAWVSVENVIRKAGGWIEHRFRVSDYVVPNALVRVRFVLSDNPNDSITEGAVDGFRAELFCRDPLATATFQNGTGMNTACFASIPCVLDTSWSSTVTHGGHAGATITAMWFYAAPSSGTFGKGGEFLVDLTSQRLLVDVKAVGAGTFNTHTFPIPADVVLAGIPFSTQAGILGGGVEFCNAYDFVVGF